LLLGEFIVAGNAPGDILVPLLLWNIMEYNIRLNLRFASVIGKKSLSKKGHRYQKTTEAVRSGRKNRRAGAAAGPALHE
jgi:hypothetical protein